MDFQASSIDIWISNDNTLIENTLKTISDITNLAMKFSYWFATEVESSYKRHQYGTDLHNECTTRFFFFKCICFYGNNAICTRTILFRVEHVWFVCGWVSVSHFSVFSIELYFFAMFVVVLCIVTQRYHSFPIVHYWLDFGFI